jgi:hypothetical protein
LAIEIVDAETQPLEFQNCAALGMNPEGNQSWVDNVSSGPEGSANKGFLRQESGVESPVFLLIIGWKFCH